MSKRKSVSRSPFGTLNVSMTPLTGDDGSCMDFTWEAEVAVAPGGASLREVLCGLFAGYDGFEVVDVSEGGRRVVVRIAATATNIVRPLGTIMRRRFDQLASEYPKLGGA